VGANKMNGGVRGGLLGQRFQASLVAGKVRAEVGIQLGEDMFFDQRLEGLFVLRMATLRVRSHSRARGIAILFNGLRGIGR
jgi:hypothetical protein